MIWCTKTVDFRLQVYKTRERQSKTNGRRAPLKEFENPSHNGKKRLNAVRKQNGGTIEHIFC